MCPYSLTHSFITFIYLSPLFSLLILSSSFFSQSFIPHSSTSYNHPHFSHHDSHPMTQQLIRQAMSAVPAESYHHASGCSLLRNAALCTSRSIYHRHYLHHQRHHHRHHHHHCPHYYHHNHHHRVVLRFNERWSSVEEKLFQLCIKKFTLNDYQFLPGTSKY